VVAVVLEGDDDRRPVGAAPVHEGSPLERARALADRFALDAGAIDRESRFPGDHFDALFDAGLLALTIARTDGGAGYGLAAAQRVVAEIARGEPSTALILAMHYSNHAAIARRTGWPEDVAARIARDALDRRALINAAQVEPETGSPSHGAIPTTRAVPTPDGWRVTGTKRYTTGAPGLAWMLVLATTQEAEPRIASFLVPGDAEGVQVVPCWDGSGMRASASHDVRFDNVLVPMDAIVAPHRAADGLRRDSLSSAWYFTLVASVYHGVAVAARGWFGDFLRSHVPPALGKPLASQSEFRDAVGQMEVWLEADARLLASIGADADAGNLDNHAAALAKHLVVDHAVMVTDLALSLAGNIGLSRSAPLERHHRDALCGRAHAPGNALIRKQQASRLLD
jgi:alkylation response protein AidB-like acyl-CoA dehydrogenase